jgi:hypothetical protein
MKILHRRIDKLESKLTTKRHPCIIMVRGDSMGKDCEPVWRETDEQAIARHLAEHPEDAGREFGFIRINSVHGQWNERGEWVAE